MLIQVGLHLIYSLFLVTHTYTSPGPTIICAAPTGSIDHRGTSSVRAVSRGTCNAKIIDPVVAFILQVRAGSDGRRCSMMIEHRPADAAAGMPGELDAATSTRPRVRVDRAFGRAGTAEIDSARGLPCARQQRPARNVQAYAIVVRLCGLCRCG